MKVLHISTSIVEQSAAYRIYKGILNKGIKSLFLVTQPSIGEKNIIYKMSKQKKIKWKILSLAERLIFKKILGGVAGPFSSGMISTLDYKLIEDLKPEVIHLHWICGNCISLQDFLFLSKYNIVWTLHDSWAFTGGCHIPYECSKYEDRCFSCEKIYNNRVVDIANFIWKRKMKIFNNVDMNIVAPSKWLTACAKKSKLLRMKKISNIPNGIDINKYKPINKLVAREIMGVSPNKKIVLFGAMNAVSDPNKGFIILEKVISILRDSEIFNEVEFVIFGGYEPIKPPVYGCSTHYLGKLQDDLALAIVYSSADVMLVPSRSENFPNTILEAMSCETPVVAFNIGGISDIIDHKVNGYLAKSYKEEDFAAGIRYVLEDQQRRKHLSRNARKKIETNFSIDKVADAYINLYKNIIVSIQDK